MLSLSALLVFVRFILGPSIADRVVALDLLIVIGMGIIALYSIIYDQPTFLDIAMIFALIAFLSTTALSYYLKKSHRAREKHKSGKENELNK
jgi:multicomponent Na+:H+ antiporter subunit F